MREIKIHLNQVGYKPGEVKRAIVVGECERFEVVDIENGGATYRRQAGNFGGFTVQRASPLMSLCLCWLCNIFCCGGRFFFCC